MTTDRRPAHRLRWWSAFAMAAILLCTVMVSVVVIALSNARSSTDVADDFVLRMGERTADLMVGHLDDAVESTSLLATLLTEEALRARDPEIGGDEFAIVFRNIARDEVDAILNRIQDRLAHRDVAEPRRPHASVAFGVASRRGRSLELAELMAEADAALIHAKSRRKGVIAWSTPAPGPAESTDEPTREPI